MKYIYPLIILALVAFFIVLSFPSFEPLPALASQGASVMLTAVGYQTHAYKNFIVVRGFSTLKVSPECSGLILLAVFIVTTQFLPFFTVRQKLLSLLFLPLLFMGNIIRIVVDVLIGERFSVQGLVFWHNTGGQVLAFFFLIILYIGWLKMCGAFPKEKGFKG